jgi:argininosuccinate lyase
MRLWGGRFQESLHPDLEAFGRSLPVDGRLALYDVRACAAHVQMLAEAGALAPEPAARLGRALAGLEEELLSGALQPAGPHEDVHSWVEAVLAERVGPEASLVRLGRSRNDLVATDLRLWCMEATLRLQEGVRRLQRVLLEQARRHAGTPMPGYTHLQRAQPVLLAHHLLAHFWALERDHRRLGRAREEADCCPLGAGALAGSPWPLQPPRTAELLGFSRSFPNSLDAVSDRDFAVDLVAAAGLCMVHLSRLAEEIVLWTSSEFAFAELADRWATGSSLMPQKKNPDGAELVRGRTGAVVGHLTALLVTLKGLPLAYNRDLQEDKPPLFAAVDTLMASLGVMAGMLADLRFHPEALARAAADPALLATDLADSLVRSGLPFARAHELAGRALQGRLSEDEEARLAPLRSALTLEKALEDRAHEGAAGPRAVARQIQEAERVLES